MISSDPLQILIETVFALLEAWAFVFSVLGNFLVIYVMTREKKLRRKSNYYIISVASVDLLVGLFGIPGSIFMVRRFACCAIETNFVFRDSLVNLGTSIGA